MSKLFTALRLLGTGRWGTLHHQLQLSLRSLQLRRAYGLGRRVYVPARDAVVADTLQATETRKPRSAASKLFVRSVSRACAPRAVRDRLRARRGMSGWSFGTRHTGPTTGHGTKWKTPGGKA